ncbi:DNA topoisomerase IB [Pararhodonellum marinum]|uniref:DNA topoisomerase IB n=1 Tax=Pararhodonellum marinum TaxID=2755358 RepID=UPI00188F8D4F|nr:DNA topoisomerase IB [Pararhodonellum marinum]
MKNQLTYIDEGALCIQRKRRGRGFQYTDEHGNKIGSNKLKKRIKDLVIPPMWNEVMICKFDDGHIQATGRDLKGRKQYIYHDLWERQKQEEKFSRMARFGKLLPKLREKTAEDLGKREWDLRKVVALMVEILDETGIRIGNKQYAQSNGTFGLSTLRRKHLELGRGFALFRFKGKSNQLREVSLEDKKLVKYIKKVMDLPGYELFRYMDEEGKTQPVDSQDVNEYINEVLGEGFSSKDFRTWVGSRLALELFPEAIEMQKANPRKKLDTILIRMVADELGNTPTVCRGYYVHPMILTKLEAEEIPLKNPFRDSKSPFALSASEKLLMRLLEE